MQYTVPPLCIAPLFLCFSLQAYNTLMKSDVVSVCGLMVMMEKLVAVASVGILSSYQRELLALFIQAFNLRVEEVQYVIMRLA